jgi:succinate-semialdehyde dehydrogenase / glutarate-semialdehyde dehydrogenase
MSSPARKVAGALSSGCSTILKASEETPAGAVQLVRAFHDAWITVATSRIEGNH